MLIIEYCRDGKAYSDFEVEKVAKYFIEDFAISDKTKDIETIRYVSSENMILAIRLYIIENKVNTDNIVFKCNDQIMTINKHGNPNEWVRGFCILSGEHLRRILKGQLKNRKDEIEEIKKIKESELNE